MILSRDYVKTKQDTYTMITLEGAAPPPPLQPKPNMVEALTLAGMCVRLSVEYFWDHLPKK